jgi:hypothetical protein
VGAGEVAVLNPAPAKRRETNSLILATKKENVYVNSQSDYGR